MQSLQPKQQAKPTSFVDAFNNFFLELQAIFPAWRNAFPTTAHLDAAKKQWLQMFLDEGINSQAQINAGLRKARKSGSDFFPAPSKFIAWCKPTPEDFGLPKIEDAYRNAKYCCEALSLGHAVSDKKWLHIAVYHATKEVGLEEILNMFDEFAFKCFEFAYQKTCEAVITGQALPEIPKAIKHKEPEKSKPEVANKYLAEMKALVGKPLSKSSQAYVDYADPLLANEGEAA